MRPILFALMLLAVAGMLLAVAGCRYVDPWTRADRPATRAMPGPDAAAAAQRFEDPVTRLSPRPLAPR